MCVRAFVRAHIKSMELTELVFETRIYFFSLNLITLTASLMTVTSRTRSRPVG
jgi:hypothetical protein